MISRACITVCLTVVAAMGTSTGAGATDILVPADHAGIQAAIVAASDGDRVLVSPGTYTETLDFLGKAIVVESTDGPESTLVNADGAGSTVSFRNGEGAGSLLRGFTLTGGSGTALDGGPEGSRVGGGVLILAASPRIECCTIRGNHASGGGGGIYAGPDSASPAASGLPVFKACVIEVNSTGESGGGLLNVHQGVALDDCLVRANVAASSGGGIAQAPGSVGLAGTIVKGNVAGLYGGGLSSSGNSVFESTFVSGGTFIGNRAVSGGGIWASGFSDSFVPSQVLLQDVVLRDNTADVGGAVTLDGFNTLLTLRRCTITGNAATDTGAAVFAQNSGSATRLESCTVADNQTDAAFGVLVFGGGFPAVQDSIVWGNSLPLLTGSTTSITGSDIEGGYAGAGNIDADPLFWDPAVADYELRPGSPAAGMGALAVELEPWSTLGGRLPGVAGIPRLSGTGSLVSGTPIDVSLSQAAPMASAFLVMGYSAIHQPLEGGVLVPSLDLLLILPTDAAGAIDVGGSFPGGVPAGFEFFLQYWVTDACAPYGFSASNGLRGVAP